MSQITITAAVATTAKEPFEIRELSLDAPRADEILVRVKGVGLCHTDLAMRDQFIPIPLPVVLGHEGSGVVERVGSDVKGIVAGDHVLLSFTSCGHCARCDESLPGYCQRFPVLNYAGARADGTSAIHDQGVAVSSNFFGQSSFATHALATARNVVKIDPSAPIELMGPLACSIQTGVGGVVRSLACKAGSSIAIFGGGAVGLSAVMGAKLQQCATIILLEPIAARRELGLELGATHVIDPMAVENIPKAIRKLVPAGVDYAFENSGLVSVVESALASLGSHGVLGLVGIPPRIDDALSINLANTITCGHQIKGIIEGDSDIQGFLPELVSLHLEGKLPFDRMIKTFKLADINDAVAAHKEGRVIKVVLLPE